MQSLLPFLALAATTYAQTKNFDALTSPAAGVTYKVGDNLPITWEPAGTTGNIKLELIGGSSVSDLHSVVVIADSIDTTKASLSWPIPPTVGSLATYGINLTSLTNSSEFQYSNQFFISGGSSSSSSPTTTGVSTTSLTSTITVPSSTTTVVKTSTGGNASVTTSPSGSASATAGGNGTLSTKLSKTTSGSATVTGSGSGSSSSSAAAQTSKSANDGNMVRGNVVGGVVMGLGGLVMGLLL